MYKYVKNILTNRNLISKRSREIRYEEIVHFVIILSFNFVFS